MANRFRLTCALTFGLFALAACQRVPTDDLTAPDADAGTLDAQGISLLAASNTWAMMHSGLPPARADMKAGTVHTVIYVVGGDTRVVGPTRALARVDAYNVATNTWSTRKSLPGGRSYINGVSEIGGLLYVTGGYMWINNGFSTTKHLFVYNPTTNGWVRRVDMPSGSADGAQGVIGGLLYAYACDIGTSEHHFFRYNPATNSWATLPSPPKQHISGLGGVINGKFYLVGGFGIFDEGTATLNVYDPATNSWKSKAPMPTPRLRLAGGVSNGKLYVAGGTTNGAIVATLQVYDPVTNKWTTKAPMPVAHSSAAAAVASGRLFIIGGDTRNGAPPTTRVEAYTR